MLDHPLSALALRIAAALVSFGFGLVAARLLGVADFGILNVMLAVVNVGVVVSLLGHEAHATREVAVALGTSAGIQTAARYRRRAVAQVWLASCGVVVGQVAVLIGLSASDLPHVGAEWLLLIGLVPLVSRTRLAQAMIRGARRAGIALTPDGIVRPFAATLGLGTLWLLGYQSPYAVGAVMLVGAILALALGVNWERRFLRSESATPPNESPEQRVFSPFLFGSSLAAVLVSQLAMLTTGFLAGAQEAGLYAAAERLALACALVSQAVYLAIAAQLAALHARGDHAKLRAVIRSTTRKVALATLALCLMIGWFASEFLVLYGPAFVPAEPILWLLLLATFLNAAAGPTGQLLLMTSNERQHFRAIIASLVVQAILFAAMVPALGGLGAALTVLAASIIWNVSMMLSIRTQLGMNPVLAWA